MPNSVCYRFLSGLLLCLTSFPFAAAVQAQPPASGDSAADTLEQRLAVLEQRLEEERQKHHIPGMAIAVVHDGQVVLARGFGLRDLENNLPADQHTLFAIGSTTKAFTSALIGMLEDDGIVAFDDPVTRHIPEFNLAVDTRGQPVTIRDLLCHRTGYTRMGLLWAGGGMNRDEVLQAVARAEPMKPFRKAFQYNNVMYMVAGQAAGRATGSTWEDLIAGQIFGPLGMKQSSTSITAAAEDEHLARGYRWNEDLETHQHLPMRNLDLIGPAGSINSSAADMARWVTFLLNQGELEGQRLISPQTLQETWNRQIDVVPGSVAYGLGWMLQEWNGKPVVEHGGNIDGFAAQVGLLPAEQLGFVWLANISDTPLQAESASLVFDTLLGEPASEDDATVSGRDMEDLPGDYEAFFSGLKGKTLKVLIQNGNLAIDIPGQRVFELKPPDEQGKWYFALTDTIAASFQRNDAGKPVSLTIHQGGFDVECLRTGVVRRADVPLDELQPLLGSYHDPDQNQVVRFFIHRNRLAVDLGAQGIADFFPPDDEGRWALRANPESLQIRFDRDDQGHVVSVTRFQNGQQFVMPRREEDAGGGGAPAATALLEIMTRGARSGPPADGDIILQGRVRFVHQGAEGAAQLQFNSAGAWQNEHDLGKPGIVRESTDGQRAWIDVSFSPFEELTGQRRKLTVHRHPLWVLGPWQDAYEMPVVLQQTEFDDDPVWEVRFAGRDGLPDRTVLVETATGRIVEEKTALLLPGRGPLPVTTRYRDFRPVGGFMVPFFVSSENRATGRVEVQYESAEIAAGGEDYQLTRSRGK